MNKSQEFLKRIGEQMVTVDEPVLNSEQEAKVMGHISSIQEEYKKLYSTIMECSHTAAPYKKRKLHKMVDQIVGKQKELDQFHRHFKK